MYKLFFLSCYKKWEEERFGDSSQNIFQDKELLYTY